MDSETISTILFIAILIFVAFALLKYGTGIDGRIQNFLEKFFRNFTTFRKFSIEKSPRFHKILGEVKIENLTYTVHSNNLKGVLNRQIVFELDTKVNHKLAFTIERNVYFRVNKINGNDWEENFNFYPVAYSKMANIQSSLQIMIDAFDSNKKESIKSILNNSNVIEELLLIPSIYRILGLPAINQYWKIYIDENYIGFAIEWSWIKTISQNEIEIFFKILQKLNEHLISFQK